MTEAAKNKPYESMPQPNEDKPITIDTFSYWSIPAVHCRLLLHGPLNRSEEGETARKNGVD